MLTLFSFSVAVVAVVVAVVAVVVVVVVVAVVVVVTVATAVAGAKCDDGTSIVVHFTVVASIGTVAVLKTGGVGRRRRGHSFGPHVQSFAVGRRHVYGRGPHHPHLFLDPGLRHCPWQELCELRGD